MSKSICFVGPDNYPVLDPTFGAGYIGGESVQQTLLARAFVELGHRVTMIVKDHGQADGQTLDGIRVWKTCRDDAGLPVVRFIHPRMTSVMRAMRKADADIYFQSCAGALTGWVAYFCWRYGRRFIYRVASDTDCIPGQQLIRYWRDRRIFEFGLRRANLIAAQTQKQAQLLDRHYGLKSMIINMVVEPPATGPGAPKDIDVLWVNNFRALKRPEWYLDLAADLPQLRFTMIGGPVPGLEPYYQSLRERAAAIGNLDFVGPVPYHSVNAYFARARLFVNTSEIEGFPNSFLQAWSRGVPVVSFFDPDNRIEKYMLGSVCHSRADLQRNVDHILRHPDALDAMSTRARELALAEFSPIQVARRYIDLLEPENTKY